MTHICHALGCRTPTDPGHLLCAHHWAMVPKDIQQEVYAHYRPGQTIDKKLSIDWLIAAAKARLAVAEAEGHEPGVELMTAVLIALRARKPS